MLSFETNVAFLLETHSIKYRVKKLEFGLLSVIQFRVKSAVRNKSVFQSTISSVGFEFKFNGKSMMLNIELSVYIFLDQTLAKSINCAVVEC